MKAVILTAGLGKRLRPLTSCMGKVLVPIYNKPMIFYSVSVAIEAGLTDIVIVCNDFDIIFFKKLFERFEKFGIKFFYVIQEKAIGTANALKYAKDLCINEDILLLFGDSLYIGKDFENLVLKAKNSLNGATISAYHVDQPEKYGILEVDEHGKIISLVEKPNNPKSNLALTGLMFFDKSIFEKLENVKLSPRGEYEIVDVINMYITEKRCSVVKIPENIFWRDTGSFAGLNDTSNYIKVFEKKNGLIGCIEVSLYKVGLIDENNLNELLEYYGKEYKEEILESINSLEFN